MLLVSLWCTNGDLDRIFEGSSSLRAYLVRNLSCKGSNRNFWDKGEQLEDADRGTQTEQSSLYS